MKTEEGVLYIELNKVLRERDKKAQVNEKIDKIEKRIAFVEEEIKNIRNVRLDKGLSVAEREWRETKLFSLNEQLVGLYDEKLKLDNQLSDLYDQEHIPFSVRPKYLPIIEQNIESCEAHEQEIIRLLLLYGDKPLNTQTDPDIYRDQDEEVRLSPKNESVYGGETDPDTNVGGNKHFTPQRISVLQFIREHLSLDNIRFENELFQKIFDEYSSALSSKGACLSGRQGSASGGLTQENLPLEHFIHHENPEISKIAIDLTTFPYSLSDWEGKRGIIVKKEGDLLETAVEYAIYSFKIKKINKMISDIQFQLQEATSEEEVFTLIAQQKRFENSRKDFAKALGWVVLK